MARATRKSKSEDAVDTPDVAIAAKLSARAALNVRTVLNYIGGSGVVIDRGARSSVEARNTARKVMIVDRGVLEYLITHGFLAYDPSESAPLCHGYTRTSKGREKVR
jgi:hypothetical protein